MEVLVSNMETVKKNSTIREVPLLLAASRSKIIEKAITLSASNEGTLDKKNEAVRDLSNYERQKAGIMNQGWTKSSQDTFGSGDFNQNYGLYIF